MVRVDEETEIPDSGAVFTFGKSKFADNVPGKFWIRNDVVTKVDCGDEHTILATENGRVYVFGTNDWGQLGLGSTKNISKPTCVKALKQEKAVYVAGGRSHSLVYTESRNLYAFGANGEGQLGLGDTVDRFEPCQVNDIQAEVKMMSAGSFHSAVLTVDGKLFMFGSNSEGQLGLGEIKSTLLPTLVPTDFLITAVSCGYYHTAFVSDGKLYTFGEKESGKLGLLEKQLQKGTNLPQCIFSITERVTFVSCGGNHTAVVTECGKLYTFGSGLNGQLGLGTMVMETGAPSLVGALNSHNVVAVSCGESHTAIVTEFGNLYSCGDGRHGKLGQGNENFSNQFNPVPVTRFNGLFVHQVACGGCHMVVLATKRANDDAATASNEDDDVEVRTSVDDGSETLGTLTARVIRRGKELEEGSKGQQLALVNELFSPGSVDDKVDDPTLDDDLDRLQKELTNVANKDERGAESESRTSKTEAVPTVVKTVESGNKQSVTDSKSAKSAGENVQKGSDTKKVLDDNSVGANGSEAEKKSASLENDAIKNDTRKNGSEDKNTSNSERTKKESFLKQIFSFKRKNNSEKTISNVVDIRENTSEVSDQTNDDEGQSDSQNVESTNVGVNKSTENKGSAKNQESPQNVASKTCAVL